MKSTIRLFIFTLTLLSTSFVSAQEKYPYTAANKNCILKLGKYEMPLFERKPAILSKEKLVLVDSIETCNCDFKITQFEINYNNAMGNVELSNGAKFSEQSKRRFKGFLAIPHHIDAYISDIQTIDKKGNIGKIDLFELKTDTISRAFCSGSKLNKKFSGNVNPCSKAIFIQIEFIRNSISDVKSFTVEIVSKDETKTFNIVGNLISQQVIDYVWKSTSALEIHIKNVIAGNEYGYSIKAEGISFQCKY